MQGISNAPCCKSFEYRPLPLTFISTLPLYLTGYSRKEKQTRWEKFQWSWFLTFKFPVDLIKICGISRGKALFCLKFPRVKLKNEKFQKVFQKSMSSNPLPHSPFPQFFFLDANEDLHLLRHIFRKISNSFSFFIFTRNCISITYDSRRFVFITSIQISQNEPATLWFP